MRETFYGDIPQSSAQSIFALLLDSSGNPVTGLTFSSITLKYLREGDTAWMNFTLSALNFVELSDGVYRIDLSSSVTANDGLLRALIQGGTIDDLLMRFGVYSENPGNVQVTVTIEDALSVPLPDTQIDIWDDAQTVLLWSGITGLVGQAIVALNPGSYKIILRRHRTTFTIPEALVVVGPGAETASFIGLEISISSPVSPDTCIIYGDIFDIDGVSDDQMSPESILISVQRTRTPVSYGSRLYTTDRIDARSDAQGHFEITLARGITVKLDIPRVGIEKTFTVPDQATAEITTLL